MEIRAVCEKEYAESCRVESVAFDLGFDCHEAMSGDYRNRRAVFQDGRIVACLDEIPFRTHLNGVEAGMAGIGGVATLPEERRKGYVRALFHHVLEESREKGDVLSYLFPFSNVYYRQFGYENCMVRNKITLPISSLRSLQAPGSVEMYRPGDNMEPIMELYEKFSLNKNLMIQRTGKLWDKRLNADPCKNNRYVYIRRGPDHEADGYLILKPHAPALVVEEMVWRDSRALKGMLGFLFRFSGRYRFIRYHAPSFLNLCPLIPEPYDIRSTGMCFGMGRIVDAERALRTLTFPKNGMPLTIQVRDDFLAWNNGTFLLREENGLTQVRRVEKEPDMICDIRRLVQLLCGYLSLQECAELGGLVVKAGQAEASRVFTGGIPCIYDEF